MFEKFGLGTPEIPLATIADSVNELKVPDLVSPSLGFGTNMVDRGLKLLPEASVRKAEPVSGQRFAAQSAEPALRSP
jgi:hypothetical protein